MTTIINNRPNVYTIGAVRLMPGPNEVDDKLAKKFLDHKAAQERIKIGHLTVEKSDAEAAAEKAAAEKAAAEKAAAEKAAAEKAAAEKAAAEKAAKAPAMPKGDDK